MPERVVVATASGHDVVANYFHPDGAARAAVLIVAAMGVTQRYYAAFAAWLAAQGFLAATFDFVGIGASRGADLRALDVDVSAWARNDCEAMIGALAARAPGLPLYWVGHSLGGQIFGFVPSRDRVAKMVTVACGSGYWLQNTPALRWRAWWIWFVVAPLALALCGYFPGRRLRKVGDLPRGVMAQWRRWCLHPDYAVGVEGAALREQFAAVRTPITSLSFADDEFMSWRNTRSLHEAYARAPRTMRRIAPQDIGARRIGHFGFFQERFRDTLWRPVLLPELS